MGAIATGSRPQQHQRPALLIGALLLIAFVGLRYKVGCDWNTYLNMLQALKQDLRAAFEQTDPAYGFINWTLGNLGFGIWAVNLACATIFAIGLVSLSRQQPNPPLAMAVAVPYLVIVVTSYTREGAAIGMVMLAMAQYSRGSIFKVMISLIIAVAFHKSAVVVFPIFALALSNRRIWWFFLLLLLCVPVYDIFVSRSVSVLYRNYLETAYQSSGTVVRVLMDVVPALLYLSYRSRFGFKTHEGRLWGIFSWASLAALVWALSTTSTTAVDRTSLYLIPLQVVILANVPSAFSAREKQNMLLLLLVVLYSLGVELIWLNYGLFARCWIPYRNFMWS